jgi:5-methylcytosine-specific restriction endonuclease McrA
MNNRITKKERNLIKGAMRRVFSRSELRRKVVDASLIEHSDPKRTRVKRWCLCNSCKKPIPKSYVAVDHIQPLIAVHETFEDVSLDIVVDRLWCEEHNLQVLCEECHKAKTSLENKSRRLYKKEKKL